MTTEQVLRKLRRLIDEVDQGVSVLTDEELLDVLADERDNLELGKVTGFEVLTVSSDVTEPTTYGILPEASLTLELGTILAYKAAVAVLRQQFRARVNRGELGITWSSGLESESTLQAAREYKNAIDDLECQADALILIKRAPTSATRPQ